MKPGPTPAQSLRPLVIASLFAALMLVLAACGGDDDAEDIATDPEPTPTEELIDEPTPTPEPTVAMSDDEAMADETPAEPEPSPTEVAEEPTPTPAEDVDLAPEFAGLTDWRNGDPVSLEELRGEPVVLVFWNSI